MTTYSLLRTKLHRPELRRDLVQRPRLLAQLEQPRQRPLTLVSPSAGYGKTTLVSSWLEMIEEDLADAVVTGGITCTGRRRKWVGATPRG